jgi:hypothetical protein
MAEIDVGLVGATVTEVRPMTEAELDREGWELDRHGERTAVVFSDGTVLYASRDDEGNGPGAIFGVTKDGTTFTL